MVETELRRLIPDFKTERLPVTTGRFHFMRKVDTACRIEFLNERWLVGSKWIGEYVRATVNMAEQMLTISHKASDSADWRVIKIGLTLLIYCAISAWRFPANCST